MAASIKRIKLYKTITYRLFSSSVGFVVLYATTGSLKAGLVFSTFEFVCKPLMYFIHELSWIKPERDALQSHYLAHGNILRIRFNRAHNGQAGFWRVIYDGTEHLADNVIINVPTFATHDKMDNGEIKSHLTCYYSELQWNGKHLLVN